tara:strand:- start:1988 stop:2398 length:411 start_codon:yes stop_codon:yes gene_type:complete
VCERKVRLGKCTPIDCSCCSFVRSCPLDTTRCWQASLTKPADLNPPANKQDEFARKFGITWKQALADGRVYNAVDGCKQLGIDGNAMDKKWAEAKKSGNLLKFGGGFYAGKLPPKEDNTKAVVSSVMMALWALFGY